MRKKRGFRVAMGKERCSVFFSVFGSVTERVSAKRKEVKGIRCVIRDTFAEKEFVGKAKCNISEDVWDEKVGMQLAFTRAVEKRYKAYRKEWQRIRPEFENMHLDMGIRMEHKYMNEMDKGVLSVG